MATATLQSDASSVILSASSASDPLDLRGDALYEVVNGRIVELPPMGAYESELAFSLALALEQFVAERRLGKIVIEMLFRIDVTRNLKRRPDVAFVSTARWPFGKRVPKGEAWEMVPDLAVEVVSPSNGAAEIAEKIRDYFQTGTKRVWVIYPETRQVYIYTSIIDVRILLEPADLDGGDTLPGFRLSLTRLFEDEIEAEPA